MARLTICALFLFVAPLAGQEKEPEYRGKMVKQWIVLLKSPNAQVRYTAALALGEAGAEATPAVKALAAAMKDSHPAVRRAVAQTLSGLGGEAAAAAPALAVALRDADPGVREAASQALTEIGDAAVNPLIEALKDASPTVRVMAIVSLDGLNAQTETAIKALGMGAKDA